jgi:hypothetical protein
MRVLALALGAVAAVGFTAAVSAGQAKITFSSRRRKILALNRVLGQAPLSKAAPETVQAALPPHPVQRGAAGLQCEQTQGARPGRPFASAEDARVSVHGGGRRTVGVRSAGTDNTVVIKRKKAARYVHSEPSVVIKKKRVRYSTYHQPSQAVIVKKRRAGVAVELGGASTRTSVRSRTSTTHESVRSGTSVRNQGSSGARSSTGTSQPGGTGQPGASSGQSGGESTGRSGG